jgi:uncharacterized protein (UPF0333 family)
MQLDWINILAFLILATVVVTLVAMAGSYLAGKMRGVRLARQVRDQEDSRV